MKISVYIQGGIQRAVTYYRYAQYLREMDADVHYRLMIPDNKAEKFLPISKQPFLKKIFIFVYIFIRVQKMLIEEVANRPDYLIVSRKLIHRTFPLSFQWCLKILKRRGTIIIWDFDDQIIYLKEVSQKGFRRFSQLADIITVGSPLLENLIDEDQKQKVSFFPTTDGDMYKLFDDEVMRKRLLSFDNEIRIIWVGTFSGLRFLSQLVPAFELLGLKLNNEGKILRILVVCDYPLKYEAENFVLDNIKWKRDIAIEKMKEAHIGLMPLEDTEETRGKCGFKLIQYMSIGLPVVVSNVGMNVLIMKPSFGRAVKGTDKSEWTNAIYDLVSNKNIWEKCCLNSITEWKENYNYEKNLLKWKNMLRVES